MTHFCGFFETDVKTEAFVTEGNAVEVKTESPLLGLAERCEQEAGPSRELDAAIAVAALGWIEIQSEEGDWRSFRSPSGQRVNIPRDGRAVLPHHDALQHFTASLDAAMTLIGPDVFFHVSRFSPECDGRGEAHVYPNRGLGDDYEAEAATPALALCAAALKARAATPPLSHPMTTERR